MSPFTLDRRETRETITRVGYFTAFRQTRPDTVHLERSTRAPSSDRDGIFVKYPTAIHHGPTSVSISECRWGLRNPTSRASILSSLQALHQLPTS